VCPKNLVTLWEDCAAEYRLLAKVLSITRAFRELPTLRRYRVVLIDESQNLRNREGVRYRAIDANSTVGLRATAASSVRWPPVRRHRRARPRRPQWLLEDYARAARGAV